MKLSLSNHIIALTVTALLWVSGVYADNDVATQDCLRYTKERPMIYEDAWDLWPYVFLDDNGHPTGYNVDLINLIMKELEIPFEIRLKPTSQALEDLKNGNSDLMLGMVANFHDDYTRYYGKNIIHMFTHSVAHPESQTLVVQTLDDLAKQEVIVHEGSFSHHLMQDRGWGDNALPYVDMDKAVQQVSVENNGQVLWNTMSLKWLINRYHTDNLMLSPVDMPSGDYRFMSNDTLLLQLLDETYARLKAGEKLQPLEMKWFYPEEYSRDDSHAWLWYVVAGVGLITLILIIASVVYHLRERKVTRDDRMRIARLALILKTSQLIIWTYDMVRKEIIWYGDDARPERTFTMEKFRKRYEPSEYEKLQQAVRMLMNKEKEEITIEINTKDEEGRNHIFSVGLSVLSSDKGQPSIIIGTKRDITDEHELQQHTDELMNRYEAVFNTAMVDMVYYNNEGFIENMNERAQQTFNMTLQEAKQKHINVKTSLDSDAGEVDYCHMTQFLTPTGEIQERDKLLLRNAMCYEMQLVPVFDNVGGMLGIYATGRNVTEVADTYHKAQDSVKQLEMVMNELSEYVSNINYAMQVGGVRMVSYSPVTHMLTINHRMHEAQYVLTQQRCIELAAPESVHTTMRMFRTMDRLKDTYIDAEVKTKLRIKGDRNVCLLVQLFPTFDNSGRVTEYNGILRDTTDIKHTEQLLMQETEKAQEVEQLKNKFLHNMCFEIRTPLNTVVENAEMFEKEHTPEEETQCIDTIKSNTAYLLDLINDILFLSRLDAKMVEINTALCDISKTIESHCIMGWSQYKRKGVKYVLEDNYEQLVVDIDDANLGRIIEQVVKNAADHTVEGMVRVRYEYIAEKLVIGVDDTGSGIPANVLEHIFERFNTTQSKNHRTGLGMPICKELVTQMNGSIDISSEVDKGTTVWITIPCAATVVERKIAKEIIEN